VDILWYIFGGLMKRILLAVFAAALIGTPALAGDVRMFDWSGWYFGGGVGWQGSSIGLSNPTVGFPLTYRPHHDSVAVSGHIGAQHQWGQLVLGIEGDYLAAFHRASLGATPAPGIFSSGGTGTAQAKLKDIWSIGGRAGWAMGAWLPYVIAGYANGSFDFDAHTTGLSNIIPISEHANAKPNGAYLGAGIDWALTNNWIFGVEYRHYFFEAKTVTGVATTFTEPVRFDPKTDTVMARLTYKFGGL